MMKIGEIFRPVNSLPFKKLCEFSCAVIRHFTIQSIKFINEALTVHSKCVLKVCEFTRFDAMLNVLICFINELFDCSIG